MAPVHIFTEKIMQLRTGAALLLICICRLGCARAYLQVPPYSVSNWTPAHASFYGGDDAAGTMGGACGYGNLYQTGYGTATAALSPSLFNGGRTCGACFEIKCDLASGSYNSNWCYPNAGSITRSIIITGTNLCPANFGDGKTAGWCNPPQRHFDLASPYFAKLAQKVAGIIPVQYRRVSCVKQGGIRFYISGNPWYTLVLVFNVGGAGNVIQMAIKGGESPNWLPMRRNWGQKWVNYNKVVGQSLSFKVKIAGGKCLYLWNLTSPDWQYESTFYSNQNFDQDGL